MKLDVMRPAALVDINRLRARVRPHRGRPGRPAPRRAWCAWPRRPTHPAIRRDYPVHRLQPLQQAASAQLRNMASLGGNVLQRTRCNYFRDTELGRLQQAHAGLRLRRHRRRQPPPRGAGRQRALHRQLSRRLRPGPGRARRRGRAARARTAPRAPSRSRTCTACPATRRTSRPTCAPGELITGFRVPAGPWTRRSLYLKVRDRASYDFALASAAVALRPRRRRRSSHARIGLGGLVAKPWRAHEAEAALHRPPARRGRRAGSRRGRLRRRRHARRERLQARARPPHPGPRPARSRRAWRSPMDGEFARIGQPADPHRRPRQGHRPRRLSLRRAGRQPGLRLPGDQRDRPRPDRRLRPGRGARGPRRARHPHPRERRRRGQDSPQLASGGETTTTMETDRIWHDGQIIAVVVADTFEAAREAAFNVRVSATRRSRPSATFDSPGAEEEHRDDGRARGLHGRRRRGRVRRRPGQRRRRIRHADPAPQPDRAVHHHLRLAGQAAHHLGAQPVRLRPARLRRQAARHRPRRRARDLEIRRRRVRLEGRRHRRAPPGSPSPRAGSAAR